MVGVGDGEVVVEGAEPKGAAANAHGDGLEEGGAVAFRETVGHDGASFRHADGEDGGEGFEAGEFHLGDGAGGAVEGESGGHEAGGFIVGGAGEEAVAVGDEVAVFGEALNGGGVDLVFDVGGGVATGLAAEFFAVVAQLGFGGGAAVFLDEGPAAGKGIKGLEAFDQALV